MAPLFASIQKVEVDNDNHVFVIDVDSDRVVAFLGPVDPPPFDAYVRDFVGDSGVQPSTSGFTLSSPDILIRHNPDVDLTVAASTGLEAFTFQQPRFDENNYVYLTVRNRGSHGIAGVTTSRIEATNLDMILIGTKRFLRQSGLPGPWSVLQVCVIYNSELHQCESLEKAHLKRCSEP
jgi:hypothetical protein